MSIITFKNKKEGDFRPYSTNPIYQVPIEKKCEFCISPGRKKIYQTLWCYYKHQLDHHIHHPDDKIKITESVIVLAKKIAQGETSL